MISTSKYWQIAAIVLAGLCAVAANAQETPDPTEVAAQSAATADGRGPVTNLPLPRYVSLKGGEANVRRGPSLSHRIDWIFTRPGMPLQVVAEYGNWRRVIDREGQGGWVHYIMLSGNRTVIVDDDMLQLHSRAADDTPITAVLESGVIAELGSCVIDWCRLSAGGYKGWAPKTALWGVDTDEIKE
jgi:SH3-like domain-containing protein